MTLNFRQLFIMKRPEEIVRELGSRLRLERTAKGLNQTDVATKANISKGTLSAIENGKPVTLENVIKVVTALGMTKHLENLFVPTYNSLVEANRYEQSAKRQRVRKSKHHA